MDEVSGGGRRSRKISDGNDIATTTATVLSRCYIPFSPSYPIVPAFTNIPTEQKHSNHTPLLPARYLVSSCRPLALP